MVMRQFFSMACTLMFLGVVLGAASVPQVDETQVVKDFESEIKSYMDLHSKHASGAKPSESASKVAEARRSAGAKMRGVRPNAKQGDIFRPEISSYFKKQIAATLSGPDGPKIKASLQHAEPLHPRPLKVNSHYPQGVPLQSTPPTLLLNLPPLPHELQYRLVGHYLVLYDVAADLIVDFIPGAVPAQ